MNCRDVQELVQDRLDGFPPRDATAIERHVADCAECRDLHAAALRLEEGLRFTRSPAPPSSLSPRVVAAVLTERRRSVRGLLAVRAALAAAAAVLLMVLVGRSLRGPDAPPNPVPAAQSQPEPVPVASLRESVTEAGSAVIGIGRRTADEAFGNGRMLLDTVAVSPPDVTLPSPIEPPVRSLASAGQAIGVGLEPVTSSARRAFDLFLRDVPMDQPDEKPGL